MGKTSLKTILNQILNNGEINIEIINIYPGITDDKLCEFIERIDTKKKRKKIKNYGHILMI